MRKRYEYVWVLRKRLASRRGGRRGDEGAMNDRFQRMLECMSEILRGREKSRSQRELGRVAG
jgi:hypothetical protein